MMPKFLKPQSRAAFNKATFPSIILTEGDVIHTIEGNTNEEGPREGFEVCLRRRDLKRNNIDIFKVA